MEPDRGPNGEMDRLLRAALTHSGAPGAGVCPEPGVLAAFAEGQLAAAERVALEPHLAACARCQTVLALAAREADESSRDGLAEPAAVPASVPSRSPAAAGGAGWLDRVSWRWLAPAAGVAALGLILYVAVRPQEPPGAASPSAGPKLDTTLASAAREKGAAEPALPRAADASARVGTAEAASSATGPESREAAERPRGAEVAGRAAAPSSAAGSRLAQRTEPPAVPPVAPERAAEVAALPPAEFATDVQGQAPPVPPAPAVAASTAAKSAPRPAAAQEVPAPVDRAEAVRDRSRAPLGASRAAANEAAGTGTTAADAPGVEALWAAADLVVLARVIDRPASWDARPDTTAFAVNEVFKTAEGVVRPEALALWLPAAPAGRMAPGETFVLFVQRTAVLAQPALWVPAAGEHGLIRLREDRVEQGLAGRTLRGETTSGLLATLRLRARGRS